MAPRARRRRARGRRPPSRTLKGGTRSQNTRRFRPCLHARDGSPMTVRGGGVPVRCMASNAVPQNGSAASELSLPMRITASWSGSSPPNRRMWRECSCTTCELPRTSSSRPQQVCRRAQSHQGQASSVAARWTASLDRSCARRPLGVWVGAKKRLPGRTKKLKDEKMDRTLWGTP